MGPFAHSYSEGEEKIGVKRATLQPDFPKFFREVRKLLRGDPSDQ
jgi:hypothetical protein